MNLPHVTFGAGAWVWALLLVPLLVALYVRAERSAAQRLQQFVSPRLLTQLAGSVNRTARGTRYAFLLLGLALAIVALAQPRWGYVFDETKRKGLDLIFAVDTSRSMLSNDVQPNRLERVKLAAQDLVNTLEGDRVGLIAFAGRAFLQAPLTIDYGAAIDAINDLDTNTIPEGGTNISAAIALATQTYTKSAVGNRALIIFTDGEELRGDAVAAAKSAADAGIRIFTVGVGTPGGSLIPIKESDDGSPFVKDEKGQAVKSKLDEARLREIAEATGGIYLHLEGGPATMKKLMTDGLGKMQAGEIDARLARRPIERYQWPLGAALVALAIGSLIRDRRRRARRAVAPTKPVVLAGSAALLLMLATAAARADARGLDLYQQQKFGDAYQEFQKTLQEHPTTQAADKLQFDAGAAAYKMKDYKKALESFSQALLTKDPALQSDSHYNLGNTLYERGEAQQAEDQKLRDWTGALRHYEQTLKLQPQNKKAKDNYEFVKKKIEDLKKKKDQPPPTPTPSPSPNQDKNKNQKDQQKDQKDQQKKKDQQQKQDQSKSQGGKGSGDGQQQSKPNQSPTPTPTPTPTPSSSPNQSPSPSPSATPTPSPSPSSSPSPGDQSQGGQSPTPGEQNQGSPSPTPGESPTPNESPTPSENGGSPTPTATPGQNGGEGQQGATPSPTPAGSPKKFQGDVKGAPDQDKKKQPPQAAAEAEPEKEGEMTPQQAKRLLESMKGEEQRVLLDERKPTRPVYKDW